MAVLWKDQDETPAASPHWGWSVLLAVIAIAIVWVRWALEGRV